MTRTKKDKTVRTDAVELNDAALDQAAGAGETVLRYHLENAWPQKSIKDGASNTLLTG